MTVQIALPLPLETTYTYAVPEPLRPDVRAGSRLVVPFARGVLTGVAVSVDPDDTSGETDDGRPLRAVLDVLDDEAAATPDLLALTRWIADYYVCGWGEALRAALPSGLDVSTEHRIVRTDAPAPDRLDDLRLTRAVRLLDSSRDGSLTLGALRQKIPGFTLALARRLERLGVAEIETGLREARVSAKTEAALRAAPPFASPHALFDAAEQVRGAKQKAILTALADLLVENVNEPAQTLVLERAGASSQSLKTLLQTGIVERFEREVRRHADFGAMPSGPPPARVFTDGQREALARIAAGLDAHTYAGYLLHGVTGSGKTEVYIEALKHTLAQGRTGIVLVPEIGLTPQTVRRFRAHFGDQIAVLHSRMSLGERYDAWRDLRAGRYPVVIGPRSALFAPLESVGLIVVDEEHEASYKQFDPAPRYHARDVALVRAQRAGAVAVLGSATPALESWQNARRGKLTYLAMPERVPLDDGSVAQLPPVRLVDLADEQKRHRLDGALSKPLVDAIRDRLAKSEQVVLLQNRRGYAPVIECEACGFAPRCRDCAVTMTYHKHSGRLRCHYCGRTERRPARCPACGEASFADLGVGTQRVEEELALRFPEARVVRMDLDTTAVKDAHHRLLDRFGRGDADILLGTQMVAKGLDFPNVTLVGVVNADSGLLLPDFRAEERTFQLLTQVAGRAGRHDRPGEVLLQTRRPDARALTFALKHDYRGFAKTELAERQDLGYPPFGRVVAVEFRGADEAVAKAFAEAWTSDLRQRADGAVAVFDATASLVARVKTYWRFHTVVLVPPGVAVQPLLRATLDAVPAPHKTRVIVDVDAVSVA